MLEDDEFFEQREKKPAKAKNIMVKGANLDVLYGLLKGVEGIQFYQKNDKIWLRITDKRSYGI